MRIVFIGSGELGVESLRWLGRSGHQVIEVVTPPARPAGRGRKLHPTVIAEEAIRLQLPLQEVEDINNSEFVEHIRDLRPEIILVIAFGQKIGAGLLNLPGCRVINLHGSLLPKYRGAAPINWAVINGEKQTGLTVIEINEIWDGGNILGKLATDIKPGERAGELYQRLALLGPQLIEEVLVKILQGTDRALVQDDSQASRAPKLRKSDAGLKWNQPAEKICNFIHGMWPWPGAFCQLQQEGKKIERITLAQAQVITQAGSEKSDGADKPGILTEDMNIICGEGRVALLQVKPENGKLMDFSAFVNGRRLKTGVQFLDG